MSQWSLNFDKRIDYGRYDEITVEIALAAGEQYGRDDESLGREERRSRSDVVRCLELLLDLGAVWDNTTPALIGGAESTIVNTSYRRSCPQLNIRPSASCGEYWNRELTKCKTSERS